ncbi:11374_t:CDS:2 [Funneliformis caledonium]|uniref:11374_t:CDS:1 n=1 Tax=Funneliformis caledonium TaxID=1117310 RepID=A0A9N9AGV6_9GLOM|nr:11374_t:CDS:2 [Funneliformis caledonium]
MSFAIEGQEMSNTITRETRQTSKVNQICMIIDELLLGQDKNQSYVMVSLPKEIDMNSVDVHVLEEVHANYRAERVGNDIFIKYDGINKENIQRYLTNSAGVFNPNWTVATNSICVIGGAERRPDIGVWFIRPTFAQRSRPIINRCPPPNVYIEDPDRDIALTRINFAQQHTTGIEFVGICIPDLTNPFHANPNPQQVSTHAVPAANQNARPTRAPYILHWNLTRPLKLSPSV